MELDDRLKLLREPFKEHQISLLPKPTKKDAPKGKCSECGGWHGLPAVHLKYVGHAALTDRFLEVDPKWNWEPMHTKDGLPAFDSTGGLWIKLTLCGVTRLGYGHAAGKTFNEIGSREKEVIGDALRNAGMRFGAALELWHKGELHVDEETEPDKKPATQAKPAAQNPPPAAERDPAPRPPAGDARVPRKLTDKQLERLYAKAHSTGWHAAYARAYVIGKYKMTPGELNKATYDAVCEFFDVTPASDEWKKYVTPFLEEKPNVAAQLAQAKRNLHAAPPAPPFTTYEEGPPPEEPPPFDHDEEIPF